MRVSIWEERIFDFHGRDEGEFCDGWSGGLDEHGCGDGDSWFGEWDCERDSG